MQITVNGETRDVADGLSVADLLETLGVPRQATAVEVNRDLVPRSRHADHTLADGDTVEIVTLVGGG